MEQVTNRPTAEEMTELILKKGLYLDSVMRLLYVFKNDIEQIPKTAAPAAPKLPTEARIYHYLLVSSGEVGTITNPQVQQAALSPISSPASDDMMESVSRMLSKNLEGMKAQVKLFETICASIKDQKESHVEEKAE